MIQTFLLDIEPLAATPHFCEDPSFQLFVSSLKEIPRIHSIEDFHRFTQLALRSWSEQIPEELGSSEKFDIQLNKIERGIPGEAGLAPLRLAWGGVSISVYEPPFIEKYLVIKKGGVLALEFHTEKDELLRVDEGAGLMLSSHNSPEVLSASLLVAGSAVHLSPGIVHSVIGLQNLLIFERSKDPLGMDQDLHFVF